ncbi:MAG: hypothetical protein LDL41_08370 [Coleofasciculus sp. S288]|nr:hypothetical protein [Coleofasciculus sp. S288]
MVNPAEMSKNSFLYPQSRYYGQVTPENLAFNANLQEFAQKVSYITALQTGGKLSSEQAYEQVKSLWKQLKYSKQAMEVSSSLPSQVR